MSVTIKAYLKLGGNANAEIRRFVVDQDVCSNFEYITKKLMQVFPSLANESFELAWKDAEGDLITFSSDEELVVALGQITEDVFRIYIQKKSGGPGGPGLSQDDVPHPGVTCDGCEMGIRGPRFKCMVCPDYDLCKKCEKRGTHPEHDFMKLKKPKFGRTGHGGFSGRRGWRCGPFGPHGGPPGPFGPPPYGPHGPPPPFGAPPPPFGGQPPFFGMGPFGGPRSQEPQEDSSSDEKKAPPSGEPKQTSGEGNQQGATEGSPNSGESGPNQTPGPEIYLSCLGGAVADMLEPLGIDVDVSVEHGGKQKKCKGKKGRKHHGYRGWWGYGGPYGAAFQPFGGPGQQTGTSSETGEKEKPTEDKSQQKTSPEAGESEPMETGSSSSKQKEEDWMFVDDDKPKSDETDQARTTSGTPQSTGFMPDLQGGSGTKDDKVEVALKQMMAMGFTNEGGWLTHLLQAMDGEIGKALDAIKMGQPPNFNQN